VCLTRLGLVLAAITLIWSAAGPAAASAPPAKAAASVVEPSPPVANAPFLRAARPPGSTASSSCPGCSYNWSGYAQVATRRHTFTSVTDTIVVPTVTSSMAGTQEAADWIGIGGYGSPTLVQAGVQTVASTANNQTTVTYDAWTEVLPQNENPLPLIISAGDTVTVMVQETATNTWLLLVRDGSQVASRTVRYRSRGLSVEAIHERPCVQAPCDDAGHLADLAQTSDVTFGPGTFSESAPGLVPVSEPLLGTAANATLRYLPMVADDGSTVIAIPSAPDSAQDSFTVADGSTTPPAPPI
jgi:hypothetical protein